MRFQRFLKVLVLSLLIVVAGCGPTDPVPTFTPVTSDAGRDDLTTTVQRGRVVKALEFNGRMASAQEAPLFFKTPGYVGQVYVQPGDRVAAGDLLAELAVDDLRNQIAQAEVALESAQSLLAEAEKSLEQEIDLAELDLAVAQASLEQAGAANADALAEAELALSLAKEQLTRTQTLEATYTAGVVQARVGLERAQDAVVRTEAAYQEILSRPWEPQDLQDAHALALQQAQWELQIAQAQYNQAVAARTGYRREVKMQEIVVKQAELALARLEKGVDPLLALGVQRAQQALDWLNEGVDPALVHEVNQAQLALERLQDHLTDAQIAAPIAGEIVSLSAHPDRPVEAFRTVIVVANPSALQVVADLAAEQLEALTEGQKATVILEAGRTWPGIIAALPYPYGSASDNENGARINLEGDVNGLALGDPVRVIVVLEEKVDALWLPPEAVRTLQGQPFVVVQDGPRQRRVDVALGIAGQDQIEIVQGITEGQIVVLP